MLSDAGVCVTVTVAEADVSPLDVNDKVCGPAPSIRRFVKEARPLAAVTVVVPDSVPDPDESDDVTEFVAPLTRLPDTSRTCTIGCVENGRPLTAPAGDTAPMSC